MNKKSITERIREYYCMDDNGDEWLVEKGKVKEGRLLKEACLKIEQLETKINSLNNKLTKKWRMKYEEEKKLTTPLECKINQMAKKIKKYELYLNDISYKMELYENGKANEKNES